MTAGANNSGIEQAVRIELVRLLFGSPTVPVINGFAALVTTWVLWRVFPLRISLSWLIVSLCLVIARLILWSRFKRRQTDPPSLGVWADRFTVATALTGCVWGMLATIVLVASDPFSYMFAAFVVGGLCAGAAIRLSPHPPALYAYICTSAPPMIIVLLIHGRPGSMAMSGLVATFTVVMILVGRENHQRLADYIRLKIEQEVMNADLQMATRDLREQITERERIAQALAESRERFKAIGENAMDAIIISGPDNKVDYWNPAAGRTFGFTADESLGRSTENLLAYPEDWEKAKQLYAQMAASGEEQVLGQTIRLRARRKDGSEFPADVSVSRMKFGGSWHALSIVRDMSEQETTLAALRERERELSSAARLLQIFVEHAPVALAMFDREMRYLAVSHRWAEDHNFDAQSIVGKSHYEINPDIPERWIESHRRGLNGETQRVEEDRYARSDGRLEWIRWQIMPWRGEDGSVGGIVMLYEDITERKKAEAAFRESKELLQLFIDRAPAALAMFDREMRYLAVSRRWLEDNSLIGQDIIGRCHYDIVPDIPERWKEAHRRGIAGETLRGDQERFERADGIIQWIRWEVVPWRASDGSIGGIVLFVEDITAQKQYEERLSQAASVFTHAREGILITDQNGLIMDVNEAFSQITGYSREEVLGKNPRVLKSGLQNDEFYRKMWLSLRETGQWSGEIWNSTKAGHIYAEMLNIGAVRDANGSVLRYVALFSDVTELKNKQQQLERIAHYDVLTGLPNRVLLADRLRQAMVQAHRRKQSVALAYIDLDEFKQVNDTHGHVAGDQLLRVLAPKMEQSLREGDTLARLGGDEFVALILDLPNTEAALPIVRRLLAASTQAIEIGSQSLRISASIGVAFYPQAEELEPDQLVRRADQAMYQAKLAGKNRYHVFDPAQDVSVRGRHESLEQIRCALAKGHFLLHYQPKVNMRSGLIVGAEALLRLQHPELGLLAPDKFLPAVEDHPLGIAVGEWVIDNALGQMEIWEAMGFHIPVSVNVSSSQLQDPAFVDRLKGLLQNHPAVKPSSLELEVLETSALRDLTQTAEVLQACHQMGVGIALDDFGTGYSSLTYLKRLPAHTLKIDRSFVGGMLESLEDRAIIAGVLGLAKVFERQVIAEGVESAAHGEMLLKMGCELAQGYGIARPMPPAAFLAWARGWHPDSRWCNSTELQADHTYRQYAD